MLRHSANFSSSVSLGRGGGGEGWAAPLGRRRQPWRTAAGQPQALPGAAGQGAGPPCGCCRSQAPAARRQLATCRGCGPGGTHSASGLFSSSCSLITLSCSVTCCTPSAAAPSAASCVALGAAAGAASVSAMLAAALTLGNAIGTNRTGKRRRWTACPQHAIAGRNLLPMQRPCGLPAQQAAALGGTCMPAASLERVWGRCNEDDHLHAWAACPRRLPACSQAPPPCAAAAGQRGAP